jgi:hypothetical protein
VLQHTITLNLQQLHFSDGPNSGFSRFCSWHEQLCERVGAAPAVLLMCRRPLSNAPQIQHHDGVSKSSMIIDIEMKSSRIDLPRLSILKHTGSMISAGDEERL